MNRRAIVLALLVISLVALAPSASSADVQSTDAQRDASAEPLSPAQFNADLDFLVKTIGDVHPNMYAYTTKEEFVSRLAAVRSRLDKPLSRTDFYELIAPLVASLRNGHTNIQPYNQAFCRHANQDGLVYPLDLRWNGRAVVVRLSYPSAPLPEGAAVLKINGEDAAAVMARLTAPFSAEGRPQNMTVTDSWGPLILQWRLWREYGDRPLTLTVSSTDGVVRDHVIEPVPYSQIAAAESARVAARPTRTETSANYSYRYDAARGVGIIDVDLWGGYTEKDFRGFLDQSFGDMKQKGCGVLIIDVRNNAGGNSTLGDVLIDYLTDKPYTQFAGGSGKLSQQIWDRSSEEERAEYSRQFSARVGTMITHTVSEAEYVQPTANPHRFHGRAFVLMNGQSYSSSTSFVAAAKYFRLATLVGEETIDTTVCYGDCYTFKLSNSGLSASVAWKKFINIGGKENGRGVLPDYEVHQKPEDTARGVDTVMDFALRLAANGSLTPTVDSTH